MLDRAHRLTTGREFAGTIRHGRRAGSPTVVLHLTLEAGGVEASQPRARQPLAPQPLAPQPRIGLVVGKAVGNAVVRNRVKRRLRHLVRDRLPLLPAGAAVVVRALPPAGEASSRQLAADLDKTLQRTLRGGEPS